MVVPVPVVVQFNIERWGLTMLWTMFELVLITIPAQVFADFLKETYSFITGSALGTGFVTLDETAMDGQATVAHM